MTKENGKKMVERMIAEINGATDLDDLCNALNAYDEMQAVDERENGGDTEIKGLDEVVRTFDLPHFGELGRPDGEVWSWDDDRQLMANGDCGKWEIEPREDTAGGIVMRVAKVDDFGNRTQIKIVERLVDGEDMSDGEYAVNLKTRLANIETREYDAWLLVSKYDDDTEQYEDWLEYRVDSYVPAEIIEREL